jgi:CRP-like cAMP-binding protein
MDAMKDLRRLLRQRFRVTESDLSHLQSLLTPRGLNKGEPLLIRGRSSPITGIVTRGCLRVYFTEPDGSDRVLYFAPEGWLVPNVEPLAGTASTGLTIDALEPTEVWILEETASSSVIPDSDRIKKAFAESALVNFQRRLVGGMRKSAGQRYAEFRRLYPDLETRIAQYHVAAYLGISPEFLSKLRRRHLRVAGHGLSTSTA